jgi:hypothetical protein
VAAPGASYSSTALQVDVAASGANFYLFKVFLIYTIFGIISVHAFIASFAIEGDIGNV